MGLIVGSLIGMKDVGDTTTRFELVDNHAGYRDCLLVLQCLRLKVFCKVIDDGIIVSVPTLRAPKRSNNVHGYAFKWCSRVDRSKNSAVAKLSFVPIANRALFTTDLDVFTDL